MTDLDLLFEDFYGEHTVAEVAQFLLKGMGKLGIENLIAELQKLV